MQRVIITSSHEVPDDVADDLFASIRDDETRRRDGTFALLLRFMQENPPYSAWYRAAGFARRAKTPAYRPSTRTRSI